MTGPDGPEDTGSTTVEGAAGFERWRARNYDPPAEEEGDRDERPLPTYGDRCRCHSASEEPCELCSGGP